MKRRLPNKCEPTSNNQESDNVVVDGITSPQELLERAEIASQNTIKQLKKMYPKSPEYELKERENIFNEELNRLLNQTEREAKDKIDQFYSRHKIKEKIKSIDNELKRLDNEYKESKKVSLIYEKEKKIEELEKIIHDLQQAR